MEIDDNTALVSLTGLDAITSVGLCLSVRNNGALTNLSGLDALTSVRLDVYIQENPALTSLEGLEAITAVGRDVYVETNVSLCEGEVDLLVERLSAFTGDVYNTGNTGVCPVP